MGEAHSLEPGGCVKPLSRKNGKTSADSRFRNENVKVRKTLARSSFVLKVSVHNRGFKRKRLKEL